MKFILLINILVTIICSSLAQSPPYSDSGCTNCDNYSTVQSYCNTANPTTPLTKWQTYVCGAIKPSVSLSCYPQRWSAPSSCTHYNGIVVLWHGFSACPDQYNLLMSQLQAQCFDIYAPLYPGHGIPGGACSAASIAGGSCLNGTTDITYVPNSRGPYEAFANTINAAIFDERAAIAKARGIADPTTIPVASTGLSLGGAHSIFAPALWHVNNPSTSLYTKILTLNGFFGISALAQDSEASAIENCLSGNLGASVCLNQYLSGFGLGSNLAAVVDLLLFFKPNVSNGWQALQDDLRAIITAIAEGTSVIPDSYKNTLQLSTGWGTVCDAQVMVDGRGGICYFKILQLFACHSAGDLSITAANFLPPGLRIQLITVERDGPTRNGLAMEVANNALSTGPASLALCMFRRKTGCTDDINQCGVPHSALSVKDNSLPFQGPMWWQATLYGKVISFLTGAQNDIGDYAAWTGDGLQCVGASISNPPNAYFASIPVSVLVTLDNSAAYAGLSATEAAAKTAATAAAVSSKLSSAISSVSGATAKALGSLFSVHWRRNLDATSSSVPLANDNLPLTLDGTQYRFAMSRSAAVATQKAVVKGWLNSQNTGGPSIVSLSTLSNANVQFGSDADTAVANAPSVVTAPAVTAYIAIIAVLSVLVLVLVAVLIRRTVMAKARV